MREVPLVDNLEDERHCYPASFLMILGYLTPEVQYSMPDAKEIVGMHGSTAPWPLRGPMWLVRKGFHVKVVFDFDYEALATQGVGYIRAKYGDEVADWQAENGSIPEAADDAAKFVESVPFEQRKPTLDDIAEGLEDNGLVAASVNLRRLNGDEGYENHYVVVFGIDDAALYLNNPGPPAQKAQRVPHGDFLAAWSYPDDTARYLMSVNR